MVYTPRLQIAQNRSHLYTLGPKVGIIYILGAPGILANLPLRLLKSLATEALPLPRGSLWAGVAGRRCSRALARECAGTPTCTFFLYTYVYIYAYVYICIYMYTVAPPVIYLFWGRLRKCLGFSGQSALLYCRFPSVWGVGFRLQAHCVLRGLGLRVFGLGLKQPSIEVQYSVLNFNTGLDPRFKIQDFWETFLWSLES